MSSLLDQGFTEPSGSRPVSLLIGGNLVFLDERSGAFCPINSLHKKASMPAGTMARMCKYGIFREMHPILLPDSMCFWYQRRNRNMWPAAGSDAPCHRRQQQWRPQRSGSGGD